jgi:type IV secretory pathway TraG/TraD family ATPase VirD4
MVAVLGRSDFRFADLKRRNVSVFLVLPPDRLATYSRWLRLLVAKPHRHGPRSRQAGRAGPLSAR